MSSFNGGKENEFMEKLLKYWQDNPEERPLVLQTEITKRVEEARNGKELTQDEINTIVQKQIQSALKTILVTQDMIMDLAQRVDALERK